MELAERFLHARQEFHRKSKPYFEMLYRIEDLKTNSYLFDPVAKTITKIEQPKTDYQIWIENNIEKIRAIEFERFNININNDYELQSN